jgi:hypothetical protein
MARPSSRTLGDLPPWEPLNERDRRHMIAWVNYHLDALLEEGVAVLCSEETVRAYEAYCDIERSRLEETQRVLNRPDLTLAQLESLVRPKRGRGRPKMSPVDRLTPVGMASQEVPRIRALWKKHYGRQNRKLSPTAEEIAAERWEVDVEVLLSSRRRDRSRRPDLIGNCGS